MCFFVADLPVIAPGSVTVEISIAVAAGSISTVRIPVPAPEHDTIGKDAAAAIRAAPVHTSIPGVMAVNKFLALLIRPRHAAATPLAQSLIRHTQDHHERQQNKSHHAA